MNAVRRKSLSQAVDLIDQALYAIECVKDEEQESFDNMPEGFQGSERGERMEEIIDTLESVIDYLEDQNGELLDIIGERR